MRYPLIHIRWRWCADAFARGKSRIHLQDIEGVRLEGFAELLILREAHLMEGALLLDRVRDQFPDHLMGLTERNAILNKVVREVGRE